MTIGITVVGGSRRGAGEGRERAGGVDDACCRRGRIRRKKKEETE
jgi:hypothetical protein